MICNFLPRNFGIFLIEVCLYLSSRSKIIPSVALCGISKSPTCTCCFSGEALFNLIGWSDAMTALVVLAIAVGMLCVCLILLVKVLRSVFSGYFNDIIKKTVNATLPKPFGWLTGSKFFSTFC